MISSGEQRKDKLESRVKNKTLDNLFYTVIKEGTNCSAFEARTIFENARRIYRLGDYQEERNLKPGQLKIIGLDAKEPAGRPLAECQKKEAIVEIDNTPSGGISAVLMTSMRSRTGGIGRNLEHARVEFSQTDSSSGALPPLCNKEMSKGPVIVVSKELIYPGLIPFGKAFQNIIGPVSLWPGEASASLSGGDYGTKETFLGSPFPFDAALQVACIWGQRFTEYVLFPVGFVRRIIHQKTKKNGVYTGRVFPVGVEKNQFFLMPG